MFMAMGSLNGTMGMYLLLIKRWVYFAIINVILSIKTL